MSLFFRSPTVTVSLPHTISFTYSNPLCVCVCAHYGHLNCALCSVLLICAHSTRTQSTSERKRMVHSRGWQEKCLIPSLYLHPHWWPRSNSIGHESQKISHKKSMTRWRVVSLFHSTLSSSLTFACNQSPIDANQNRFLSHKSEWTEACERGYLWILPSRNFPFQNGSISICFVVYNITTTTVCSW